MGIQFISFPTFPMEIRAQWARGEELPRVPPELQLMAVYRLAYLPPEARRPVIDWSSRERKRPSQYVFRGTCDTPQEGWDETAAL